MCTVRDDDVDIEEVIELGERFFMKLYGKLFRMPTTSRAFRFYILGTHLEVHTSRNLFQSLKQILLNMLFSISIFVSYL